MTGLARTWDPSLDRTAACKQALPATNAIDGPAPDRSLTVLDGEDVDQADVRILGEELGAGPGERGGDLAGEVSLTRCLVLEGIEDPERGLVHAESVPDAGARLSLHDP